MILEEYRPCLYDRVTAPGTGARWSLHWRMEAFSDCTLLGRQKEEKAGEESGGMEHIYDAGRDPAQTLVPNRAPTPAVTAIASAPQKVTRIAPHTTLAPPT